VSVWDVGTNSVIETWSLASVTLPPPSYEVAIKENNESLSALQLETIKYACQQHERQLPDGARSGYFIGDGAGVGKDRTIAGIILKNYQLGRKKAVWLSVSLGLKYDVVRDLKDIRAVSQINVHALNNIKSGHVMAKGIVFATRTLL
jgi:hypothetical protein